jgi:hypothetical protein
MTVAMAVTAADLAEQFLRDVADRPERWQELLTRWCSDRGLSVLDLKDVAREVLRRRNFGTTPSRRRR